MNINKISIGQNSTVNGGIIQGSRYDNDEKNQREKEKKYDIAVSYASEQEEFVSRVVKVLRMENKKVFFAPEDEKEYKAKDMFEEFYQIYRYRSKFVVCFISKEYLKKEYTLHEYESAYNKNKKDNGKLIVVSMDGTLPPHYDRDKNYIDAQKYIEIQVADEIMTIIK